MNKEITNSDILEAINEFRKEVKNSYVSIDRFVPVERLAYGLAGVILLTFVTAGITFIISKMGVNAAW